MAAGSRKLGYLGERRKPLTFDVNFRALEKSFRDRRERLRAY